jgi:hypothetical protein
MFADDYYQRLAEGSDMSVGEHWKHTNEYEQWWQLGHHFLCGRQQYGIKQLCANKTH